MHAVGKMKHISEKFSSTFKVHMKLQTKLSLLLILILQKNKPWKKSNVNFLKGNCPLAS